MIGKLNNKDKIALLFITILTLIALVYGFSLIPSPFDEHQIALDQTRVSDLGELQATINTYYQSNHELPQTLDDLKSNTYDPGSSLDKIDPQTNQPYEYKITGFTSYQLCASFNKDSKKEDNSDDYSASGYYSSFSDQFQHPAGHYCFAEQVNTYSYTNSYTPPIVSPVQNSATPSAVLSTAENSGECQWTPIFTLKGFAPYSQIHVSANDTLSELCTGKPNQRMEESTQLNEQTDAQGTATITYPRMVEYGEYTFRFTDAQGNTAVVHTSYDGSPFTPTPSPSY